MRFAVLQFGGSNCDQDAHHVVEDVCGVDCDLVWYKDGFSRSYDAIVIPGGFSYGDYLRAGAIATRTPVMQDVCQHAAAGGLVLGICNGAQIGAESGLIPGVFTINEYPKFICEWVHLKVENASSPFTSEYTKGDIIRIPIAHKEGRYVAEEGVPQRLLDEGNVAFRFCDAAGNCTPESNPNGSALNITGILSEKQNVLLMMPHPERAAESVLGSEDGKKLFDSMINCCEGSY